jgi:hypothetical protein
MTGTEDALARPDLLYYEFSRHSPVKRIHGLQFARFKIMTGRLFLPCVRLQSEACCLYNITTNMTIARQLFGNASSRGNGYSGKNQSVVT